jgi:hypothetical protein
MFNWENEIKKFTPELKYLIHHGGDRARDKKSFEPVDVIITTYGTLRSDIKLMLEIEFDFVILDESQAIKNPHSKVTKAASLLRSKNRLCWIDKLNLITLISYTQIKPRKTKTITIERKQLKKVILFQLRRMN